MAPTDIKVRIHNIVDRMPENLLPEFLSFIQEIESAFLDNDALEKARKIIIENKELLQKLSQNEYSV